MKAVMTKRGGVLIPADAEGRSIIDALREGKDVMVEVKPARNPRHHRMFFALLNLLVENTEAFDSVEGALTAVKIACGEVDPIIDQTTGKTFWTLRSIAFEKMDQARFNRLFERALHIICDRWLVGTDTDQLRSRVFEIVDGPAAIGVRAA